MRIKVLNQFSFRNYLFKHLFQKTIIILRRKGRMRRHVNQIDRNTKENRYDQFTNLGIDLESTLNKSIILPKIYNKIAEIEANDYVRQRRAREDRDMNLLKDEIDRLRRRIYMFDEKKMVHRFKTEDQDNFSPENQKLHRYKQSVYLGSNDSIRNSTQLAALSRFQRNTDKDAIRRQDSSSIFIDKSQVKLDSPILKIQNKQPLKISSTKDKDEKINLDNGDQVKTKNKKNIKSNPKLKRKFRIVALAVYFSLFIPAYAKKHYQNRLKLMMQEYPHQVEKYSKNKTEVAISKFKMDEAKLWNFFDEKLNILDAIQKSNLASCLDHGQQVKMIKDHFQFLINNELSSSDKQFKQHNTYEEQIMFPRNLQYLLQGFQTILTKFFETFTNFITKNDFFLQRWKTFSLGIMNNSFVHNSHPKLPSKIIQSGIIRLHPFKEILLVLDQQTESLLLCYDIICRIFAYKWMVKLEKIKSQPEYTEQVKIIASFMISLLYFICQDSLDSHLKEYFKENGEATGSVRNRNKYIRPIVPLLVKTTRKRDEKLLKTDRLISNPPLEEQVLEVIANNVPFVLSIQSKLKSVSYALFERLKIKMKEENIEIKLQTLNEGNIFKNPRQNKREEMGKQNDDQNNASNLSIDKRLRIKLKK